MKKNNMFFILLSCIALNIHAVSDKNKDLYELCLYNAGVERNSFDVDGQTQRAKMFCGVSVLGQELINTILPDDERIKEASDRSAERLLDAAKDFQILDAANQEAFGDLAKKNPEEIMELLSDEKVEKIVNKVIDDAYELNLIELDQLKSFKMFVGLQLSQLRNQIRNKK